MASPAWLGPVAIAAAVVGMLLAGCFWVRRRASARTAAPSVTALFKYFLLDLEMFDVFSAPRATKSKFQRPATGKRKDFQSVS